MTKKLKLKGGWEPEVLKGLKALQREYKYEYGYETDSFSYVTEHLYTPDFLITLPSGKSFFIEAKGYWDAQDRAKLRKVIKEHPDLDLRMLFKLDNKMHRSSPKRYSDYCKKYDIPFAVGAIPKDWFIE